MKIMQKLALEHQFEVLEQLRQQEQERPDYENDVLQPSERIFTSISSLLSNK